MKTILKIFLLIAVLCLAALPAETKENIFPLAINDGLGRKVIIEKKPVRVISLSPSITEILYSLGADKRIVAVTNNCNYPPQVKEKARIGDIHLDYEKIIELKPDLLIAEGTIQSDSINKLEKLGMKVLALNTSRLYDFRDSFIITARSVGEEAKGIKLLADFDKKLSVINSKVKKIPQNKKPGVFMEIWNQPLITAGSNTFINDLIEKAGGINVAVNSGSGFPRISLESLIEKNPQVIILTTSKKKDILSNPLWKNMEAVKKGRVYEINPDLVARPTLRMIEALKMMNRWFYSRSSIGQK
ncbi:MAG: cobalamin-binding protein [Firmicutes bacterium]|nr:cobalamin-binding protein [Bacillota bacterium]